MFITNCAVQICSRHQLPPFEFANQLHRSTSYFLVLDVKEVWLCRATVQLCIVCKKRENERITCFITANTIFCYCVHSVIDWGWLPFILFRVTLCAFSLSVSKMSNYFSFFFTYTQAVALKGERNVSSEPVLAGKRWLTLRQNRKRKEKREREGD